MEILKKYESLFEQGTLDKLHKNPIIFPKRKFRIELEKVYNLHTRRLLRVKSDKKLSLKHTLKNINLINNNKSRAIQFVTRMLYSADKLSGSLPEAKRFLEFLSSTNKKKLLFYLYLRQQYKVALRVGFLDHLNGNTSFESFPISNNKAKNLLQKASDKDIILRKKLLNKLNNFSSETMIQYYVFLCEFSQELVDYVEFSIMDELVHFHSYQRGIERINRFDEIKHESENPFEKKENLLLDTQKLSQPINTEEMRSTKKLKNRSISVGRNLSQSKNKRLKENFRSRSKTSKSRSSIKRKLTPLKKTFTRSASKKSKTSKKIEDVIVDLDHKNVNKQIKTRHSLQIQVEKIIDNSIDEKEKDLLIDIEEEVKLKTEKIMNKFVNNFNIEQKEVDEYGHNLGYTVFAKARLGMAFVVARERKKFFNLMRHSLGNTKDKSNKKDKQKLLECWENLLSLYNSILGKVYSRSLVKQLVIELFKFPVFRTEIVFLLKYFFKVIYF